MVVDANRQRLKRFIVGKKVRQCNRDMRQREVPNEVAIVVNVVEIVAGEICLKPDP